MTAVLEQLPRAADLAPPEPNEKPEPEKKDRGRSVIASPELPDDMERRDAGGIVMLAAQVYTTGSDGADPWSLMQVACRLDALVLNIRAEPFRHAPGWNQSDLERTLGNRYRAFPAWSPKLYEDGWGLADWISGREAFLKLLRRDRTGRGPSREGPPQSIILGKAMSPFDCHRQWVAARLRDIPGYMKVHSSELMLDLESGH